MNKVKKLLSSPKRIIILLIIIVFLSFGIWKVTGSKQAEPEYQTAQAEKGTLISSVSASGNITTGSSVNITTSATGIVNNVYVKNGDKVEKGQKIADLTLDQESLQKQLSAWSSYLSSQNQLESAKAKINSLQSAAFKANQTFINGAVARELDTDDPTYIQQHADWLQAEADYKNQTNTIIQAQTSLSSAWLTYQLTSPNITSPISGIISNLTIAPGLPISSSSTGTSSSSQSLGSIITPLSNLQAIVNLSEIDVVKIKPQQKVTLTADALPDKTFTGKVILVNTSGQVSSSVTTYPVTIAFDTTESNIYPNMVVSAKIITYIKDNALLILSSAIQTNNEQQTVRVLKDKQINSVIVETGQSNDTKTEIISGISEGEIIITSINLINNQSQTQQGGSPFSGIGGNRNFPGGAVRIQR